jgi:Protein of unknown function (DUF2817)
VTQLYEVLGGSFPADYAASRRAFLQLCSTHGAQTASFEHPARGPGGEPLATDVARFGPEEAESLLIVSSGTHGIEGLCAGGIQAALLKLGVQTERPDGVALVFVHALNPYGFAYLRRTNEDNVDLNRNFLDHSGSYPDDAVYSEVHPLLVPEEWHGPPRAEAEAALACYVAERGARALQAAVSRGQYSHPDGLFYGGRKPAWSNDVWRSILRRFAGRARRLAAIDLHSGLGARGACELISGAIAGSREHRLARLWFGEDLVFPGSTSTAPAAQGFLGQTLPEVLPDVAGALVVAEFGTVDFATILEVLRADNWLHARGGGRASPLWNEIKREMRAAFVGEDVEWQAAVVERALTIVRNALAGLAQFERLGSRDDRRDS